MGTRDARVDRYVDAAADFARPVLTHLRGVVHGACPAVEETIKWGFLHFMYGGTLCSMAAFKEHCAFGFWRGALVAGEDAAGERAMGQFGRITSVSALPPDDVLTAAPAAAFERLSPSHRREYAEWVAEARGEATRARRVATAVAWIAEGRSRNWKYERG